MEIRKTSRAFDIRGASLSREREQKGDGQVGMKLWTRKLREYQEKQEVRFSPRHKRRWWEGEFEETG